jgi:hypothetical protein
MDKELSMVVNHILTKQTKRFLDELNRLMYTKGLQKAIEIGRTQFKHLKSGVAQAACVEELYLFINYQAAKKEGWDTQCDDGNTVAANVIASLNTILTAMEAEISTKVQNINSNRADTEQWIHFDQSEYEDSREIRLRIAEKFLGYLYWNASIVIGTR